MDSDLFGLARFVEAQTAVHGRALAELKAGEKRSHWMWFVFPQIGGLGFSAMAQRYAISSVDEARAYLGHAVLGARLRECVETLVRIEGRTANEIFGGIDAMKLRSSLTLFALAAPDERLFTQALDKYFGGNLDAKTLELLGAAAFKPKRE